MKLRNAGCGPPPQVRPPGADPHANPAANRAAAVLPGVGWPFVHEMRATAASPGRPNAPAGSLATVEYSPALAKRKEVPQLPRTVAPTISSRSQVKATLGLVVEPERVPL